MNRQPMNRSYSEMKVQTKPKKNNRWSPKSKSMNHLTENNKSTHQLYKQCLEIQRAKDEKRREKLRLQNRVNMLKKDLAKKHREKAREQRKKQQLQILHEEEMERRKQLDKIKQRREKEVNRKRALHQARTNQNQQKVEQRKRENLEYKRALAQNARFQSKIREKVAIKHAEKDYYKRKKAHDSLRMLEQDRKSKKNQHLEKMMKGLSQEYQQRLAKDQKEINKQSQEVSKLNQEVQLLTTMLNGL